jgi:hypothetical protein
MQMQENFIEALARTLPPLKRPKHPVVAAIVAVLFGGFGLALYLRSWVDAGLAAASIALILMLSSAGAGVGALAIFAVLGQYAWARVHASNRQLERGAEADDQQLVPAA